MDNLIEYACDHYIMAQCLLMLCILLAGINIPVSLDVTFITAGALASICPEINLYVLYPLLATTAWVSAWEAYWIGRLLGPKLYQIRLFSYILTYERVERLHHYYEKFGIFTFLVGRFVPGGVRNALFLTSGLGKMPFYKFILRDLPACFLSTGVLFYLGYVFGSNYKLIVHYFKTYNLVVIGIIGVVAVTYFTILYFRRKKSP